MLAPALPTSSQFKGLQNVSDPLRLGLEWLVQADNVNITDTGAISKREGYSLVTPGAYSSAYSTLDFSRMYVVVSGTLRDAFGNVLAQVDSSREMHWCEVNENVYFNNGLDSGVILADGEVLPWRDMPRSYGAGFKGDDGKDHDVLYDPLPLDTGVIQHWRGRMYVAQYFPQDNQTAVWASEPLGYHLFSYDSGFFMVPGQVTMLAPHEDALIVGTDARIYAYGEKMTVLADYGVIPGQPWSADGTRLLFWTARGLCAALPFANLTERQISVAPGVRVAGCIVHSGGQKRFLAVLQQGGSPFNAL